MPDDNGAAAPPARLEELRALVDEYFGDIPRRADPVDLTISAREPERTEPRSLVATAPNVPLPVAGSLWKGPGSGSADSAALDVLAGKDVPALNYFDTPKITKANMDEFDKPVF